MAKKKSAKEEEVSLDFDAIKNFFKDFSWKDFKITQNKTLLVILILIPIILSVFFRVQSAYLPVTENWAQNSVYQGVQNNIRQQINQQYPNLPAQQKQELVNQQFNRLLEEQPDAFDQQVRNTANQFKSRLQTEDGQTYLLAIDPYMYYRWIENKVETGNFYDTLKDGQPWNTHKFAPLGQPFSPNFHIYAGYYLYSVVSMLNPGLSLMTVFFFLPVIISALAVIPAFFIARKKAGDFGGFVAATLVAIHTSFLGRTAAGFSDTDAYNVFFPLMITWLFLEAFEADTLKKRVTFGSLAGVFTGIFSYAWSGWWYIFDFLLVVIGAYFGYVVLKGIIKHKSDIKHIFSGSAIKNTLVAGGSYVVFSGIFISLFAGFQSFIKAPLQPLGFRIIKQASKADLWPNVYTTVAELGDTSLAQIVGQMGGKMMFFIAMLGAVLTLVNKEKFEVKDWVLVGGSVIVLLMLITDKFLRMDQILYLLLLGIPLGLGILLTLKDDRDIDIKYALFLTVWFIGTIYATTKGVRFTLLLVPAFAVAFGIALGMIKDIASGWINRELGESTSRWTQPVIMILLLFLLFAPLQSAVGAAQNEVPSMNDAWWNSLNKIQQESEPDAIINSWWDFGHWFKAIADRAVTFDGASQNTPMAHWIGKTLLTNDEDTAVGILRMLDCGSTRGFEAVNNVTEDTVGSVNILNQIIVQDEEDARQTLSEEGFSQSQIDNVMQWTHCEPPENYFITSQDMVGKAGVWAHFGSWRFERAYMYEELRDQPPQQAIDYIVENFNYTEDRAQQLYYDMTALQSNDEVNRWIAPWPSYVMNSWRGCSDNNETITCNLGMSIGQQQGQHTVIERIIVNKTQINESRIDIGAYSAQSGQRLGGSTTQPRELAIAGEDRIEKHNLGGDFGQTVLIDTQSNNPRVMIMNSMLADSTFTKLFYLDGRYMDHFDKFSDQTSFNGQRIIIWKVDWDGGED